MNDAVENRRSQIPDGSERRVDRNATLDRLEQEVERVVRELVRSREGAARLRMRVGELEEALKKKEEEDRAAADGLIRENRELRSKLERIVGKTREMMRKLEVIE